MQIKRFTTTTTATATATATATPTTTATPTATATATKTPAMKLGEYQYPYNLYIGAKPIEIEPTLKVLGVTLDQDLSFKPHVAIILKKRYAKIAALRTCYRI